MFQLKLCHTLYKALHLKALCSDFLFEWPGMLLQGQSNGGRSKCLFSVQNNAERDFLYSNVQTGDPKYCKTCHQHHALEPESKSEHTFRRISILLISFVMYGNYPSFFLNGFSAFKIIRGTSGLGKFWKKKSFQITRLCYKLDWMSCIFSLSQMSGE